MRQKKIPQFYPMEFQLILFETRRANLFFISHSQCVSLANLRALSGVFSSWNCNSLSISTFPLRRGLLTQLECRSTFRNYKLKIVLRLVKRDFFRNLTVFLLEEQETLFLAKKANHQIKSEPVLFNKLERLKMSC